MNRYRMFFVQTSTVPSSMHRELAEHGKSLIQTNQLQTRSHLELEDDSTVYMDRGTEKLWASCYGSKN